jgi:UDP-2,4-diacetamido-2,4,6-trideoxy-beta-L-altropyranose hydrolase
MLIVFRVDASIQIGNGHVIRCLTLADALKDRGSRCLFICREHAGNLLGLIRQRGHDAFSLTAPDMGRKVALPKSRRCDPAHIDWLGANWHADAVETLHSLKGEIVDWLIIDHYSLDYRWEFFLRPSCRKLMVIDDLADRKHDCNLLLDQNLGRQSQDYLGLVPEKCLTIVGPSYALLRPEFSALRQYSLQRRKVPQLKHLLITMGGIDQPNATSQVLLALRDCSLPEGCHITVVMGPHAPWLSQVFEIAAMMPWTTDVKVDVSNMAQLMSDSDLAIGAAGSTSWERCCLGVPTLMLVLAKNQQEVASSLEDAGAVLIFELGQLLKYQLENQLQRLISRKKALNDMIQKSIQVIDGDGVHRVLSRLIDC